MKLIKIDQQDILIVYWKMNTSQRIQVISSRLFENVFREGLIFRVMGTRWPFLLGHTALKVRVETEKRRSLYIASSSCFGVPAVNCFRFSDSTARARLLSMRKSNVPSVYEWPGPACVDFNLRFDVPFLLTPSRACSIVGCPRTPRPAIWTS